MATLSPKPTHLKKYKIKKPKNGAEEYLSLFLYKYKNLILQNSCLCLVLCDIIGSNQLAKEKEKEYGNYILS